MSLLERNAARRKDSLPTRLPVSLSSSSNVVLVSSIQIRSSLEPRCQVATANFLAACLQVRQVATAKSLVACLMVG